ncbi:SIS domain-containing protein [Rhizobium sp. AG207R]|uniref:SIS domain-containing protein n=1 Tax=Rhizobium sp. AG207R TaxID=2802287 RepID=UPI0022AC3144|nr:SIS domain-containing protein [Rhizobium sp. AG207R]MCZ3378150.1 SIS domain-containing protein [Rhizobium sp. AG207R]
MIQDLFARTRTAILQEIGATLDTVLSRDVEVLIDELVKARQIFCVGAGRSGILLSTFCMRLNHLGRSAYMAGGLPCPPAGRGDLIVAASGSGKSGSVNSVLKTARAAGAHVVMFTASNADPSSLEADCIIRVSAPTGLVNKDETRSLQPMRSLFEQSVFIACEAIVSILKDKMGMQEETMANRHANLE